MFIGFFFLIFYIILGIILIMLMIALVLGILALFGAPNFFKSIKLYYEGEEKEAYKKIFYAFLFVLPLLIWLIYLLQFTTATLFYKISMGIFLISSFVGLAVFLLFLYSVKMKNIEKSIKALLMGAVVFIFFAPSGFFTLKPIVMEGIIPYLESNRTLSFDPIDIFFSDIDWTPEDYDTCHEQEDFLMGGFCTSLTLNVKDIVGKWNLEAFDERDYEMKEKNQYGYFILNQDGSVDFHTFYIEGGEYGSINYLDTTGTWRLDAPKGDTHPKLTLLTKEGKAIVLYFDSETTLDNGLCLTNQYSDPDAPHYLRFKRDWK